MKPRKRCDDLWAEAVKKRADNKCERCGKDKVQAAHHIIPRTNYALRYDLENGVSLCHPGCHIYWAHKDALAFYEWIKDKRDLKYLESRRYSQSKNDYQLIEIYLKNELEKI